MADEQPTEVMDVAEKAAPASAGKDKVAKGKKDDGKKGKKGAAVNAEAADGPSVAAHPRAQRAVARAKGWGALGGFLIGGYTSMSTGTLAEAGLRALVAGCVCYVAVWAGAVFVWRRLVILEIKGREQQLLMAVQKARQLPGATAGAGEAKARAAS